MAPGRNTGTSVMMTSGPARITKLPILWMMMNTSIMKKSNNPLLTLELLYADDSCLAVHKEPGIPVQTKSDAPPWPLDRSLEQYLNEPIRVWTRIDQPVSGIVLFYRGKGINQPKDLTVVDKTYLGIVEGHPDKEEQTIISHLARDGKSMKAVEDPEKGKYAELSYTVLKKFDHYTLLQIKPATGRFHQIRKQLAQIGYPVKGDVKYGAKRKNANRSIHLHAMEYVMQHQNNKPVTIFDYVFPDDPLWSIAQKIVIQEKTSQQASIV